MTDPNSHFTTDKGNSIYFSRLSPSSFDSRPDDPRAHYCVIQDRNLLTYLRTMEPDQPPIAYTLQDQLDPSSYLTIYIASTHLPSGNPVYKFILSENASRVYNLIPVATSHGTYLVTTPETRGSCYSIANKLRPYGLTSIHTLIYSKLVDFICGGASTHLKSPGSGPTKAKPNNLRGAPKKIRAVGTTQQEQF